MNRRLIRLKVSRFVARRLKPSWLPLDHPLRASGARLNLGCGSDYWLGYVNVDNNPGAVCDLCMDFTRIGEVFPEGSVTEVVMIHAFSYLPLWQAREFLVDGYRMLKPGGRLIIELPDLAKCMRRVLESEGNLGAYLDAVRGLYGFDMDQIERREAFTPYAFGWSGWHLKLELEGLGFREVSLHDPQTHGPRPWRDTRVEAVK